MGIISGYTYITRSATHSSTAAQHYTNWMWGASVRVHRKPTPAEEETEGGRSRSEATDRISWEADWTESSLRTEAWGLGWGQATALSSHRPPISKPEPTSVPRCLPCSLHRCDIPIWQYPIIFCELVGGRSEAQTRILFFPLLDLGVWEKSKTEKEHTRHHHFCERNKKGGNFFFRNWAEKWARAQKKKE